eukprot:3115005-Prymnesium_polylepis.2
MTRSSRRRKAQPHSCVRCARARTPPAPRGGRRALPSKMRAAHSPEGSAPARRTGADAFDASRARARQSAARGAARERAVLACHAARASMPSLAARSAIAPAAQKSLESST